MQNRIAMQEKLITDAQLSLAAAQSLLDKALDDDNLDEAAHWRAQAALLESALDWLQSELFVSSIIDFRSKLQSTSFEKNDSCCPYTASAVWTIQYNDKNNPDNTFQVEIGHCEVSSAILCELAEALIDG